MVEPEYQSQLAKCKGRKIRPQRPIYSAPGASYFVGMPLPLFHLEGGDSMASRLVRPQRVQPKLPERVKDAPTRPQVKPPSRITDLRRPR